MKAYVENGHVWIKKYMEGWWKQEVHDQLGRLVDEGTWERWERNLIVSKVGNLFTWFLAYPLLETSAPSGIMYYSIGSGLTSWDTTTVTPEQSDEKLETELSSGGIAVSRKQPTLTYLDSSNQPTASRTNRVQLTVTYGSSELNSDTYGKWREFGVWGGDAQATVKNSGYLINHVIHGAFQKTSQQSVTRKTRFWF